MKRGRAVRVSIPSSLLCPLSRQLFRDPVCTTGGAAVCERDAVFEKWAKDAASGSHAPLCDPSSGAALSDLTLVPNWAMRQQARSQVVVLKGS